MIRKYLISSPGRVIFLSIFSMIAIGSTLLYLPISQTTPVDFIDCLFTATSATCVTGSLTIPFANFSDFGQIIILILTQIGGIGLLTISLILVSLFVNLGFATQLMFGQFLELESWKNTKKILFFIGAFTVILEILGAIGIFFTIKSKFPIIKAIFYSIFHSISAFCNSGMTPLGVNLSEYSTNIPFLIITGSLIFAGGYGFITWYEIALYLKSKLEKRKRFNLSLTSKIIYSSTFGIILTTFFLLLIIEGPNQMANSSWLVKISNILFNSLSYRSAGFTTLSMSIIHPAVILIIMIIGFIGSSPGSTGSGIKVTTFSVLIAAIQSTLSNKGHVNIRQRKIPRDQVFKAIAVVFLSLSWILISTFFLLLTNGQLNFITLLFEAISSFSNLGISTASKLLNNWGKSIVTINMFFGRIGSITLILMLRARKAKRDKVSLLYPEERPMIN